MDLTSTEDCSSPVVRDMRIILLGKTGSGKSATGNTILQRQAFNSHISPSSVTETCKEDSSHFGERTVSVVDTPGVFDTLKNEKHLKTEIEDCFMLSDPGPHIFLLVIRPDVCFTEEEKNSIKWIKDNFGEDVCNYTLVLFTRGDELKGKSVEDYLDQSPELTELISSYKAGYVVFDNTRIENRTQVADLFEKIDKIVQLNGNYYTRCMYEEAQRKKKIKERWSRWGGYMNTAGNQLMVAAVVTAAVNFPVVGASAAAAASTRPIFMLTGAAISKGIGRWMNPKTDSHVKQ